MTPETLPPTFSPPATPSSKNGGKTAGIIIGVLFGICFVGAAGYYVKQNGNPLAVQQQSFINLNSSDNDNGVIDGISNPLDTRSTPDRRRFFTIFVFFHDFRGQKSSRYMPNIIKIYY